MSCITLKIILFFLDQEVNSVKSHTTVVAYNTSTSVCIRKSCDDLVVTRFHHFRCINIKYSLVVGFVIFCKNLMKFFAWLIAVCCTSLLRHIDSAVRHECTFQRLICLKSYNCLQLLHAFINISRAIRGKPGNNFCFHIKNTAFCALFLLQFLKSSPQFICCLCRSFKERCVSLIRCVVALNKVAHINRFLPVFAFKSCPLLTVCHDWFSLKFILT